MKRLRSERAAPYFDYFGRQRGGCRKDGNRKSGLFRNVPPRTEKDHAPLAGICHWSKPMSVQTAVTIKNPAKMLASMGFEVLGHLRGLRPCQPMRASRRRDGMPLHGAVLTLICGQALREL
jgi:hypothetical protein